MPDLHRLTSWVLGSVVVVAVLDPAGGVLPWAKYALLALFAALAVTVGVLGRGKQLQRYRSRPLVVYVLLFSAALPAWGLGVYVVRGEDGPWSIYLGALLYFAVLVLGVATAGLAEVLQRSLVGALTALAVLVWFLLCLQLAVPADAIYAWGHAHDVYVYATREYGGLTIPYVYYYSSPMLCVAAAYWVLRATSAGPRLLPHLALLAVMSAMLLSGTRAAMGAVALLLAAYTWRVSRRAFAALAVLALGALLALLPRLAVLFDTSGSLVARSNARKLELLGSYAELFSDPVGLLTGYGLGSCVESAARDLCMPVTELTYLDLVRVFGLVGGLVYVALLVLPLILGWRRSVWVVLGTAVYLLTAIVNPYIFSTNGMLVLAVAVLNAFAVASGPAPLWRFRSAPDPGPRVVA